MLANMTVHGNYFSYTFSYTFLGCRSPKVSKETQNKVPVNKASFADQQSLLLFYVALSYIYINTI